MYRVIGNNCIRFKNHQICEFGQLWRLPEGEDCKIGSFSWWCKLFKILFLTTFISIKTLYDQILNIFVDQICQIFEFFKSGKFWRLLEGEQCILEGWSWISMLFKMTFLTTFILIKTLYHQIWNICVRLVIFLNFSNLENFGDSWGENNASWKVDHENQCCLNEISDNFYSNYKAVKSNLTKLFS